MEKKKIALITGASSGLGREFARQIQREPIDEIWAVARREDRLRALAQEVSLPVRVLPLDLTKQESLDFLAERLKEEGPDVRLLVNAAGFGKIGDYKEVSIQDSMDMIDLNCRAAVAVTQIVLSHMSSGGHILEISSTSAFQPFPSLNVYAATKAFLMRYSRALRWELFGQGILVTAVCPYWVRDTEFIPTAKDTKNGQAVRHFPMASKSKTVVRWALIDSKLGLAVSTPGPVCFLHRIAAKFIPHFIMIAGWEGLRRL